MDKLNIIIPAAGIGKRMKSYGPKALIHINESETIISRQVKLLKEKWPKSNITVITGFEHKRMLKKLPKNVKIIQNTKYNFTNVAESITLGILSREGEHALIVYGDLIFNYDTIKDLEFSQSFAVIDSKEQFNKGEVGVIFDEINKKIYHLNYNIKTKWAQITYLTSNDVSRWIKHTLKPGYERKFGFELLNEVIDSGGNLIAVEPENMKILEIDSIKDIEKIERIKEICDS